LHQEQSESYFYCQKMSEEDHAPRRKSDGIEEAARAYKPRRALPTDVVRPTRAEVQLDHLRHNLGVLRRVAGGTPIWAVLKADGYGHGSKAVARTLERAGADGVCVALAEEGVELREAGIQLPILVMGGYYGRAEEEFVHFNLTPVLSDVEQVRSLAIALRRRNLKMPVHAKIDTGMARLGTRKEGWPGFLEALSQSPELSVEGLMSHLANADVAEKGALTEPLRLFSEARAAFEKAGFAPTRSHLANSAALLRSEATHFDMVRPGIALFGVDPLAQLPGALRQLGAPEAQLKPTLSVMSRVVSLRSLAVGDEVGYGGCFKAARPSIIATVPMGYADGLNRALSGRAEALVRGRRAPLVGNVSMDMTTLDG
jgi:alanine racemase